MKRFLTPGRGIAFLAGVGLVFLLWGLVFTPGGTGSNIVLGILIAVACVYLVTTNFGPHLDDHFFHGGSKRRALLTRSAERLIQDMKQDLQLLARHKKKARAVGAENIEKCEKAIFELKKNVEQIRGNWSSNESVIDPQIESLSKAIENTRAVHGVVHGKNVISWFSNARSLATALLAALALRAFLIEPFQIPSPSMYPTLLIGDHLFVSKLSYGIVNPFSSPPKYLLRWAAPKPGDVVVFEAPLYVGRHGGESWIKRVIAGPGQTVRIADTVVYVDDKPYAHIEPEELISYLTIVDGEKPHWVPQEALETKEKIGDIVHDIYMSPEDMRYPFETNWPTFRRRRLPGLECTATECVVKKGYMFVMGDNRGNSADSRVWGAAPIANVKGKAKFVWISVDGSRRSLELGRFTLPGFRWDRLFQGIN